MSLVLSTSDPIKLRACMEKNISTSQPTDQPAKKNTYAEKYIHETARGVFGFFITRARLVVLLMIAIIFGGMVALLELPREADPEVKVPIAVVVTAFPGANPSDVEDLVTDKIEKEIEGVDRVKLVTSTSVSGVSSILVEFEAEADLEKTLQDLKDAVDRVNDLPDDATDPQVEQVRINDAPIITLSLAGHLNETAFKELAEEVQDELEKIPGVSRVALSGVRERVITIRVKQGELDRLHLSLGSVLAILRGANVNFPLGNITLDGVSYNIRSVGKFTDAESIAQLPVSGSAQGSVLVQDIAEVTDGFADRTSLSRISLAGGEPEPTVSLAVYKKTGGNILQIVDAAKEKLVKLKEGGIIPEEIEAETSSDYSVFIRKDLTTLGWSGVQSAILIFIIMFLALSLREALISFLAIPLTFFITFFCLYLFGFTLNSVTLFILVLSLGLLVDAFIIILEGIFHNMREGYTARDASLLSVAHYKKPLLAGVFTTISAFVPMLLVSGILGRFLRVLPITLSITLLASLFVSLVLVPTIASVVLRHKNSEKAPKVSLLEKYVTIWLIARYKKSITAFLASRKRKVAFLGMMTLLFFGSLGLLISGFIPIRLFPSTDIEFSFINIEMPQGTRLAETENVVREVEDVLRRRPEIKTFVSTIGSSLTFGFGGGASTGEHLANINLTYVGGKERNLASYEIEEELREELAPISRGKITIQELTNGPPTGAPIEARITGKDMRILSNITDTVIRLLEETEGTRDVTTDRDTSPADMVITLRKDALAASGLQATDVASTLRTALYGVTATEVTLGGKDIDVVVKLAENELKDLELLANLSLHAPSGERIPLSRVADFNFEPALASIHHRDFERTVTVHSWLETGYTPTTVVPLVEERLAEEILPSGYAVVFGGEVEDIDQSFSELWRAMVVAVLLIVFILVLQFNSFKKPLAILLSLPFALIAVVAGMVLFHLAFSFSVFLGLISLIGITVNDAIVLIDKADRHRNEASMSHMEAAIHAGETRLQPILLTSATTIAGIVPLAFADEFWFGLSIAIAFGLAFATIIQLYMVPMFYLKLKA